MTAQVTKRLGRYTRGLSSVVRRPTRLSTWGWWLALIGAAIACGVAVAQLKREMRHYKAQETADASLLETARLDHAALIQALPSQPLADFSAALPSSTYIVDDELRFASRLCSELHVTLVSMTADPEVRRLHALGRIRVRLQIRGPYSALSTATAGLLDRFPGLVVLRAQIQPVKDAGGSTSELIEDQQLELIQFIKPDELR